MWRAIALTGVMLGLFVAGTTAVAADAAGWVDISGPLLKQVSDAGLKSAWPGKTGGVAVDPSTGDVYVVLCGLGIWKSADQGATFTHVDGGTVGGRCEFSYSLNADPAGKRLACFMLDGKCAMTLDGGSTWRRMKDVDRNWDYAAVHWADAEPKTIFAARHEADGEMYLSHDGGQSWQMIGKEKRFDGACIGTFGENTLVMSAGEGILRSTDAGTSWTRVSDLQPVGRVVVVFRGVGYWLGKDALLVSKDNGLTWARQGGTLEAGWGPFFGADEKHIMVMGPKGFFETTDAGATWNVVAPRPQLDYSLEIPGRFLCIAWDPRADVLYASRMGSALLRYDLKRAK